MKYLFLGIGFILAGICFAVLGILFNDIPAYVVKSQSTLTIFFIALSLLFVIFGLIIIVCSIYLKKDNNEK